MSSQAGWDQSTERSVKNESETVTIVTGLKNSGDDDRGDPVTTGPDSVGLDYGSERLDILGPESVCMTLRSVEPSTPTTDPLEIAPEAETNLETPSTGDHHGDSTSTNLDSAGVENGSERLDVLGPESVCMTLRNVELLPPSEPAEIAPEVETDLFLPLPSPVSPDLATRRDPPGLADSWRSSLGDSIGGVAGAEEWLNDLRNSNPEASRRLAEASAALPEVGTEFLGYHLLSELGRGAFGRVFLTRQSSLANRLVVLKVAADLDGETQTLGQLQHTNIIPIYSAHRSGPFQAFSMPYYGGTTLADIIDDLGDSDSLPRSGRGLVGSLRDRSARTRKRLLSSPSLRSTAWGESTAIVNQLKSIILDCREQTASATHSMLAGMSYHHAVLWIVAGLADGLAHAHQRGILHRALKPANVLLSAEGQPMLLDFNLSTDVKSHAALTSASIGGTLPYMAPEHLEAFRDGKGLPDERADIYSLGIILFELLTRCSPYQRSFDLPMLEAIERMIQDRRRGPTPLPLDDPQLTPAIRSIVNRCLAPDPARRYRSAEELSDDLNCQLEYRPLRHAPDRSIPERVGKWVHRHPKLTSPTILIGWLIGALLSLVLVGLALHHGDQRRTEARVAFQDFGEDLKTARLFLNTEGVSPEDRRLGIKACRDALARYRVLDSETWVDSPRVSWLKRSQQATLLEGLGELLWLLARANMLDTHDREAPTTETAESDRPRTVEAESAWDLASQLNILAERCYAPDAVPSTVWSQRAELARGQGDADRAQLWQERADQTPTRTARDHYLAATEHAVRGRYREALPLLKTATRLDPEFFWAWFVRGVCHAQLSQNHEALACDNACIALRPHYGWSYYNRGLTQLRLGHHLEAIDDFDAAAETLGVRSELDMNRALAHHGLGRHDQAIADLTTALSHGAPKARTYFMRARIREDAGDTQGAAEDRQRGFRYPPRDALGWTTRGLARMSSEPEGALADFEEAL